MLATVPREIIKVSGHQYWWLAGGYDLEIGHLATWWLRAFLSRFNLFYTTHTEHDRQLHLYQLSLFVGSLDFLSDSMHCQFAVGFKSLDLNRQQNKD